MKEFSVVPTEAARCHPESWSTRIHNVASLGSQQCRRKNTVHSAVCTITGTPDELVVNLACTAKREEHLAELMQYVNDVLLPQMEKSLGIQFEVRNLQFAVTGRENLIATPEQLDRVPEPTSWLDQPFAAPPLSPLDAVESTTGGPHTDLSMV